MSAARASGTDLASSLKRNTFLTLGVRPVGRGPGVRAGRGDTGGPGTGEHGEPRDGGTRGSPGRGDTGGPRLFMGGDLK